MFKEFKGNEHQAKLQLIIKTQSHHHNITISDKYARSREKEPSSQ